MVKRIKNVARIGDRYRGTKQADGKKFHVFGDSKKQAARRLNQLCKDKCLPLPNPSLGCEKPFDCVRRKGKGFVGEKSVFGEKISVSASTASVCAKKLNTKCKEMGVPMPNPEVGSNAIAKKATPKAERKPAKSPSKKMEKKTEIVSKAIETKVEEAPSTSFCVIC